MGGVVGVGAVTTAWYLAALVGGISDQHAVRRGLRVARAPRGHDRSVTVLIFVVSLTVGILPF